MSSVNADTRTIDLSVDLNATPDQVWMAISDGEWLSRWFSPIASAEPGEGGHVTVSWGAGSEWTNRIAVWRPGAHLRLEDAAAEGGSASALDYLLEPCRLPESCQDGTQRQDGTRLRLVNSGLPGGADSKDFIHMMENGWRFFLWNLKHVLERHPGVPRVMLSARPWVQGTREEVWSRLFASSGFGPAPATAGDRFRFPLDGGEALDGVAVHCDRPWAFAGMVESFGDGVLHVELEGSGGRWKLGVWLSAYGVEPAVREKVGQALKATVGRLFKA